MIYTGPLGQHSCHIIEYFEVSFAYSFSFNLSFFLTKNRFKKFNFCCVGLNKQSVPGIPKIRDNHNPATWMLDVSSQSAEVELGLDFAKIYHESALYK